MERIIIDGGTGEIVEKKSRFIATIKPVNSEEEATTFINEMKKKYWDAKHNCTAYVVNGTFKFSDDGEPSGTAGKPMLDVLLGRNLTNVAVVVTRYFGGILLGTGGLVRAYQKATVEGLDNSVIAEKKYGLSFNIKSDYNGFSKIQRIATNENINIMDVDYTENVDISFVCEEEIIEDFIKKIVEATAGKAEISERKKVQFYSTNKGIQLIE
jgi:uncharacterized YigZ family protein